MVPEKQKILIADDSEMNRTLLVEMLKDNFEIAEVENGRRVEVNPEVITNFIDYLNKNTPKNLGVADISKFLLSNQLLNLLVIDGYEVKLKND